MKEPAPGMSLIELMITLSIAAVLLSIAAPSLGSLIQENRITAMSNTLVSHLQYARHEAVFRRSHVAACPGDMATGCTGDNRWDQGFIVFIDDNRSGQPNHEDDILRVVGPDDRMLMHSAGRTRVRFQPHGGAFGTNLTIRVCDQSRRATPRAVIVSNPGRVRVEREIEMEECEV
jgi:type IV fimbrial biogenesis protein FimT